MYPFSTYKDHSIRKLLLLAVLLTAVLLLGGCFTIDIQTPDGEVPAAQTAAAPDNYAYYEYIRK